jgi:uncharacterized protein (TIGR01244 family)
MEHILNFIQINDHLATSGQPTETDFAGIAAAGYTVVINLAMPNSTDAIPTEGAAVTAQGLMYVHLPVKWEAPTLADVETFFTVMAALDGRKVWVHCALNMRVSCFVYLYQKYIKGMTEETARQAMDEIWEPDGVWQELIDQVAKSRG